MKELWENVTNAIDSIKSFLFGFIDICGLIFGFIPEPANKMLGSALVIIVAIVVIKVVRK